MTTPQTAQTAPQGAQTWLPAILREPVSRQAPGPVPVHVAGTDVPDCSCQLVGVDAGFLHLVSDTRIAVASVIEVSFDHVQLSGVVADCRSSAEVGEEEWLISIALSASNRRLADRISTGEDAIVGVIGPDGAVLKACTIVDTSQFGIGLRLSFELTPGARVSVEVGSTIVFGEVRYCHPRNNGEFSAGILVVDVVSDVRLVSRFSVALSNLRYRLGSGISGRPVPAFMSDRFPMRGAKIKTV